MSDLMDLTASMRDQLLAEQAELRSKLAIVERRLAALDNLAAAYGEATHLSAVVAVKGVLGQQIIKVLENAEGPLTTRQVCDRMAHAGHYYGTESVHTRLNQLSCVRSAGRGLYVLDRTDGPGATS